MKLAISRDELLRACRLSERLVPERTVRSASAHVLLRAGSDGCTLLATDHEAALSQDLEAEVEMPGDVLVPARAALAVFREARADELSLESAGDGLLVRGPGARFHLEGLSPSHFPAQEPFPGGPCHQVEAGRFRRAVQSVLFAAGPGSRRYFLDAVLCEVEADRLRLVATDNRRLAVAEVPVLTRCEHLTPARRLLPSRAAGLLARLPVSADGVIDALFGTARAFFRTGGTTLSCRYAEGPYPRWRSAIPPSPPHRLTLPVRPLLTAVKQAAVLREREGARLVLRCEAGRLMLESSQAGAGRSRVARQVPFEGGPVQVALNPRYLVEMLRCLEDEETVRLELTDQDTAALFRAGDHYTHVLMPLKV